MNIVLCCSAGMSTSLLVSKMESSAKAQGIDCTIWAVGSTEVNQQMDNEKVDVLLLGPQVRFLLPKLKAAGEKKGIPVDSINPMHYGLCNGEEVLKQAIKLIKGE
jgi:cellobiose PTS system EIIB component